MLRLELNGAWEPEDFIEVFRGIESLYYKAAVDGLMSTKSSWPLFGPRWFSSSFFGYLDEANEWFVSQARMTAIPHVRMSVARIDYASPGSIDLLGFARALEVVCDAIGRIVVYYSERDQRRERDRQTRIETEIRQTELKGIKNPCGPSSWKTLERSWRCPVISRIGQKNCCCR